MFDPMLRRLDEVLDDLAVEDVAVGSDAQIGANLVELRKRVDRLDAEWQRRFAVFDRRVGWKHSARTAAAQPARRLRAMLLRRFCRFTGAEARMRVLMVRRLPRLGATQGAYAAGEIGYGHVATIVRSVTELRDEHVDAADPVFADAAKGLAPQDLLKVVNLWRDAVDPEAPITDLKSARERRRFWAAVVGDTLELGGRVDKVDGEPILAALHAYVEAGRVAGDTRSLEQRRADALVALAEAALRAGQTPTVGGERPHISVTMSLETLEARAGGSASLEWGGDIPGEVARMLACDARVCRIVVDANGIPVEASAPTRSVPAWLRRLVVARDQHCRMPGCDRPAGWCVAHHIVFWGNGGPTQLDNLVLLCRSCHNDIHLGRWKLRLEADGTVVATSPDGIEYTDPPPGRAGPSLPLAGEERAVYRVRDPVRTRTPARAGPCRVA